MKFEIKKSDTFGWNGVKGWSANLGKKSSVSYIEISVAVSESKTTLSDRIYLVVEGEAEFVVKKKKYRVKEKESVTIPKNTFYSYSPLGKLKLVEVNIPPFNEKYQVTPEKKIIAK